YISRENYFDSIKQAKDFLNGRSQAVRKALEEKMQAASDAMNYEAAAIFRNRLAALGQMQNKTNIELLNINDADVIAVASRLGKFCVQIFFVRGKAILGNTEYFPTGTEGATEEEVLEFFIESFYQNRPVPGTVMLSHQVKDADIMAQALTKASGQD